MKDYSETYIEAYIEVLVYNDEHCAEKMGKTWDFFKEHSEEICISRDEFISGAKPYLGNESISIGILKCIGYWPYDGYYIDVEIKDKTEELKSYFLELGVDLYFYGWEPQFCMEHRVSLYNTADNGESFPKAEMDYEGNGVPILKEHIEQWMNKMIALGSIREIENAIDSIPYPVDHRRSVFDMIKKQDWFKQLKKESKFSLGNYKSEKVNWLVIKRSGNAALAVSEKILDEHDYTLEGNTDFNYSDSDMRKWLTETMLPELFSEEEREYLIADEGTGDKLFLPSNQDVYLLSNEDYRPKLTNYAQIKGVRDTYVTKPCNYSENTENSEMPKVHSVFTPFDCRDGVAYGVRPAVLVDLKKVMDKPVIKKRKNTKTVKLPKEISIGSYKGIPMLWIPVKASLSKGKVLCLNKHVVDVLRIDKCEYKETNIRKWLVNEFYKNSFTIEEKKRIVNHETLCDPVFLISKEEIIEYGIPVKDLCRELSLPQLEDSSAYRAYYDTLRGKVDIGSNRGRFYVDWYTRDWVDDEDIFGIPTVRYARYESNMKNLDTPDWDNEHAVLGIMPCIWYKV